MFLFLEPIKNETEGILHFLMGMRDGFKKYETNFFPKKHPQS